MFDADGNPVSPCPLLEVEVELLAQTVVELRAAISSHNQLQTSREHALEAQILKLREQAQEMQDMYQANIDDIEARKRVAVDEAVSTKRKLRSLEAEKVSFECRVCMGCCFS
jgi:hypothetical protein